MSWKERFREYVVRKDRRFREVEETQRGRLRNRSYHGYFEGHTEYTVVNKNGRSQIRRVYTADYYKQDLRNGPVLFLRLAYAAMLIIAAYCLASGSMDMTASCNLVWYVTIWQACCIVFLFRTLMILCNYITLGREWKIYDYKLCHKKLVRASTFAASSFGAAVLGIILHACIAHTADSWSVAGKCAAAGVVMLLMGQVERRIRYVVVKNNAEKHYAGGVEIK